MKEKNLSDFHSVLLEKPWRALLSLRDRARRAILRVSDYDHSIWYFRLIFIVLQNKYLIKQPFHYLLYCSIKDSTSNTMPKFDGMPFIIFCNQLIINLISLNLCIFFQHQFDRFKSNKLTATLEKTSSLFSWWNTTFWLFEQFNIKRAQCHSKTLNKIRPGDTLFSL